MNKAEQEYYSKNYFAHTDGHRAEEIKRAISTINITLNGKSLSATTASFGVAAYPEHGDLPNQLIAAADKALYHAKNAGRNCVVSYDSTKM